MIAFINTRLAKVAREKVSTIVRVDVYALRGGIADTLDLRVDVINKIVHCCPSQ